MTLDISGPILRQIILLSHNMRVDDCPHWSDDTSQTLQRRWQSTEDHQWMLGWSKLCGKADLIWPLVFEAAGEYGVSQSCEPYRGLAGKIRERLPVAPIPPISINQSHRM